MANYRTWMKQFRTYFDAARLDTLPCTEQQAYLNNCIDDVLRGRVNPEAYSHALAFWTLFSWKLSEYARARAQTHTLTATCYMHAYPS